VAPLPGDRGQGSRDYGCLQTAGAEGSEGGTSQLMTEGQMQWSRASLDDYFASSSYAKFRGPSVIQDSLF